MKPSGTPGQSPKALARIYRKAAEIVLSPRYDIANGSCGGIGRAELGWHANRWSEPCYYISNTEAHRFFAALFDQGGCLWWDGDDRQSRAIALCLAAAILERP